MSEGKEYYTPFLEEFHIGFEYEERLVLTEKWEPQVFPRGSALMIEAYTAFIEKAPDRFRVKYLDKEDIESLGWKRRELSDWFYFDIPGIEERNGEYFLNDEFMAYPDHELYWRAGGKLCIYNEERERTFRGTIRNKSELKRLMKQLGIQ